ncbi:MAG TPA: protein phosphatase 2C domain-containing protein [Casimicrobiaceae bacterium]|nr:protein phosphatase 2C domain-containing protein [Casimicrobiaceae bacterium]
MNVARASDRQAPRRKSAGSDRSAFVREAVFATGWIRLDTAVASSRGRSHAVNEDWHSALGGTSPLFVVADGVSSGAMASCASRELVSRLHERLAGGRIDADAVRSAVLDADRQVGRSIASLTDASGAATVALCAGTGAWLSRWLVAWVGDCRVYRVSALHNGPAQLLTLDDTYRHLSEQPPPGGSLDDPARMVGNGAVDAPNVRDVDLGRDEMLLLCSDGVHKHAGPNDIARLLRGTTPLAARCVRLIEFARTSGSNDDATVLVVHRAERARARLARLVSIGALIALFATALLLLAADWVTAQRLPAAAPNTKVQP